MIAAAIVGLGRWGRNFVESIQGRSSRLQFVCAVDSAPAKVRDFAARHGLEVRPELAQALGDPQIQDRKSVV